MLKATYIHHKLNFKRPSGTSRGILSYKDSWFIKVWNTNNSEKVGIGECSIIPKLSIDNPDLLPHKISEVCQNIAQTKITGLSNFPALQFAIETALLDLKNGGKKLLFDNNFYTGEQAIPINGLLWMGSYKYMLEQLENKIAHGFNCIKMKVSAINWQEELSLLTLLRKDYPNIEIRVDANGAFSSTNAMKRLEAFAKLGIHSIEQPVAPSQTELLAELCKLSPLPIALDESLIGIQDQTTKIQLLEKVKPQYIILKPSLLGGFSASEEWINIANERNIGWWATSALESNIGLNAIAQWTAHLNTKMPQGLGTGGLFTNNIDSPLEIKKASLCYNPQKQWQCL